VSDPDVVRGWRSRLPLPLRCEEEAFFYQSLYMEALAPAGDGGAALA